jgi:hypothetical protein
VSANRLSTPRFWAWVVLFTLAAAGGLLPGPALATSLVAFGRRGPAPSPQARFQVDGLSGKPWREVFEWLSEQTELPVITSFKPVGTFTYIGPKGMKYTLPEVVAVLNEVLIPQKPQGYKLVRREKCFVLIPVEDDEEIACGSRQQGTAASAAPGSASMDS